MEPLKTYDKAIMDIFYKEHDITPKVMVYINRVPGYLEVFTLADIATGDGTKIRPCFILEIKSDTRFLWDSHMKVFHT